MLASAFTNFCPAVALRKESVDRNVNLRVMDGSKSSSLSARRAWIEIVDPDKDTLTDDVALRKESVDRNTQRRDFKALGLPSLSARRAWIEMLKITITVDDVTRRSPQGERG